LKYKAIRSRKQYNEYARILEDLVFANAKGKAVDQEIERLGTLIDKWDDDHNTFKKLHPIALLQALMKERNMKAKGLADILGTSMKTVSDILDQKGRLSINNTRILTNYFKVDRAAFNTF
jgi:HTH-type transcriptional regulator/antitoxin HigA